MVPMAAVDSALTWAVPSAETWPDVSPAAPVPSAAICAVVSDEISPVDNPLTWVEVSAAMTAVDSPPICSEVRLAI